MRYHKTTYGFVTQIFNDAGELLTQTFTESDQVDYETEDGDPIDEMDMPDKATHPFDMRGPM